MTESEISKLGSLVKEAYIDQLRARGGRWCRYDPGPRFDSCWERAARVCVDHGFDPGTHVRALTDTVRSPYPNMLVGTRAVERTRAFMPAEKRDDAMLLRAQVARLHGCLRTGEALADVLNDPSEELTPAVRFCLAVKCGHPDVASKLREAACVELRQRPQLRTQLQELLSGVHMEVVNDGAYS